MSWNYYAVKNGFIPGIYTERRRADRQIDGFPGAVFRGCFTRAEAEAFVCDDSDKARAGLMGRMPLDVHDDGKVARLELTPSVRAALVAAGFDLRAR